MVIIIIIYLLITHQAIETAQTSRQDDLDEQDRQAPGALMAALIKHTKFPKKTVVKRVQMLNMKAIKWPTTIQTGE